MTIWRSESLRRKLTWRMIIMQALVLLAFTGVAAVPIYRFLSEDQRFDDNVVDDIVDSINSDSTGAPTLTLSDGLVDKLDENPGLWVYAVDASGRSLSLGKVPDRIPAILSGLTAMNSANIAGDGADRQTIAILRRVATSAGQMWVVTGGGPEIGFKSVFGNPLFAGLLALLTVVSFLVIPVIVRRQLRGVDDIAAEADAIDVDQRGIRLSVTHVPTELHSLVSAVNAALQRLDDGMERRQRFLADAAHEMRTPIAILQTRIELLPNDEQKSRLMLDVARLSNLANQLLDLERLDADIAVFGPVNLVELAAQVTADMAPLAISAGDEISFDAEADQVMVSADPASLSRAIINLIQNAIIHGGKKTEIHVAVGVDGTLRVVDSGPGIAAQHRNAIFEPFNRIVPLDQGSGLGLSLVKEIVDRHKGRVTVGDAPSGGALFEIVLPVTSGARLSS